ncbi:MAG: L,D-transpeptidase family protein [Planctomycetes bacterium]|nr:L,D-transpeptidase family protein [Planctomycetota bacterium]
MRLALFLLVVAGGVAGLFWWFTPSGRGAELAANSVAGSAAKGARQQPETAADRDPRLAASIAAARSALTAVDAEADPKARQQKKVDARAALTRALETPGLTPAEVRDLAAALDGLNAELLFSPARTEGAVFHTVKSDEFLLKIAKRYGTTVAFLVRTNGLTSTVVYPGQALKIVPGPALIKVDKSDFLLRLYQGKVLVKACLVGIGKNDSTPAFTFTVVKKKAKPEWNGIPYGDPRNILGERWLGFNNDPASGHTGLGIHGTTMPETVPGAFSSGCIRMRNEEVIELYDLVSEGTTVEIQD